MLRVAARLYDSVGQGRALPVWNGPDDLRNIPDAVDP